MSQASVILLVGAAVFAALDWSAVVRDAIRLEYVAKPATTLGLLGVATTLDVPHDAPWAWRIAALVLCLLGDVFLMLPRDAFVPGLASFALAQMLLTVSFLTEEIHVVRLLIALGIAVPVAALLARRFVGAIRRGGHDRLVGPVVTYLIVITSMAVSAVSAGSVVAVVGAFLFMLSDSLIAESRFVRARPWHPVGIMVTYHFALVGLVLGLL